MAAAPACWPWTLAREAEARGYWKLLSRVFVKTAPAGASSKCGFREVGVYRNGRLDGVWRDVVIVERLIG